MKQLKEIFFKIQDKAQRMIKGASGPSNVLEQKEDDAFTTAFTDVFKFSKHFGTDQKNIEELIGSNDSIFIKKVTLPKKEEITNYRFEFEYTHPERVEKPKFKNVIDLSEHIDLYSCIPQAININCIIRDPKNTTIKACSNLKGDYFFHYMSLNEV